jgi:23S rRNA (cytidine1920-2'-O)/16S rRNA (cytidine1409-2'-O)-methyltransferase
MRIVLNFKAIFPSLSIGTSDSFLILHTLMPSKKNRLDLALVAAGLAPSREKAQALILAGEVLVNDSPITKASHLCNPNDRLTLRTPERYVSRGGYKLEAALIHFQIQLHGFRILDIGASTGGFTDCALQHGAASVTALDVGKNQIAWQLRNHPRVTVIEKFNARYLSPNSFPQPFIPFDAILMDVSFISQKLIWPTLPPLIRSGGSIISLIKPQFEACPKDVARGGIVRNPVTISQVLHSITAFISTLNAFKIHGIIPSPILGREGNQEYLLFATRE